MKRIFDFSFSLLGIIFLLPFLFLVALLIIIDSKGPIFFKQERIGRNAKPFLMYKFRSMIYNHTDSNFITSSNDKRITRFGRLIRKYKIDELPELFNVLIGDMSLVGPRPDVAGYADKLIDEERILLSLRPGITGPASLKYANEEELLSKKENPKEYNDKIIYPDKVRINLHYYYNHNLYTDIKIIFATLFLRNFEQKIKK
tara:strand:- start:111 stop:713 length:603 start_codon:yes stop_codon:yes gene_type:complete